MNSSTVRRDKATTERQTKATQSFKEMVNRHRPGSFVVGGRFRPCALCGDSPARHNPLNDSYVGHEYR